MQSRALGKCLTPEYQLVPCLASRARQSFGEPGKDSNYYCHLALCSIYGFRFLPSCCDFRSQGSRPLHLLSFSYTRVTWLVFRGGRGLCKGQTANNMQLNLCMSVTKKVVCACVCVCCVYACVYIYTCVLVHVEIRRQSWVPFLMSLLLFV